MRSGPLRLLGDRRQAEPSRWTRGCQVCTWRFLVLHGRHPAQPTLPPHVGRYPGRVASAAPAEAGFCQGLSHAAIAGPNRAAAVSPAGPSCGAKAGRAAPSSLKAQTDPRSAARACCLRGSRALGPALQVGLTPTLTWRDRQAQRVRPPTLVLSDSMGMGSVGTGWARQRRLETRAMHR